MRLPWKALGWLAVATSAHVFDTVFSGVQWDDDNWTLINAVLDQGHYQSRINLANGYIGINLAALGPFFEVEQPVNGDVIAGWPLFSKRQGFATVAGFWDVQPKTNASNFEWLSALGWESVISGIPHWSALQIDANGHRLNASTDPREVSDFESSWNFRDGLVTWQYTWTPPGCSPLQIEYAIFLNKLYVNHAAIRLNISSANDATVTVVDSLEGNAAVRSQFLASGRINESNSIWSSVQPQNLPHVSAHVVSTVNTTGSNVTDPGRLAPADVYTGQNASSIAQLFQVHLAGGKPAVIEKHVGIASTDAFEDPMKIARSASQQGAQRGFQSMLHSHKQEWHSILSKDKVDDFHTDDQGSLPDEFWGVEHQILAVTNSYQILQNTVGQHAVEAAGNVSKLQENGVSVCGLSSDCYAGQVFWDMDVWVAPGLTPSFPSSANQVGNYRIRQYEQAKRNIGESVTSSQAQRNFSTDAAIYSWTSSRYGNCTAVGPCWDYEYHLNGDISLQFENHWITTGDTETFRKDAFPVYNSVAQLYSNLLEFDERYNQFVLKNATDPDEFANHVDNPAFTMALIKTHLAKANQYRQQFGLDPVPYWQMQSDLVRIPQDKNADIILEYDGMNGTIQVKQADVILIDHLLDFPNPYTLSDLDFYAARQSADGPGMTYGVFSIIASLASPSGCSGYTYDVYGSQPYARGPWFQFSEQLIDDFAVTGFHPSFPFLTGSGGANQVAIFGYLGLKLRHDALQVDPALPPQIPQLRYRTFYWQGHAIQASSNQTHTRLQRGPSSDGLATANTTFLKSDIPVRIGTTNKTYNLALNQPLTIPNRIISANATVPGNIVQCQRVYSAQAFEPGQYPLAAVDGALSTKWVPSDAHTPSSIVITLPDSDIGKQITSISLDWATTPAHWFSVALSNSTSQTPVYQSSGAPLNFGHWHYIVAQQAVEISKPFDAAAANRVAAYASNTTTITLKRPAHASKYALLTVWGNQANGSSLDRLDAHAIGASVAEFALVTQA